jgi:hypothetical protein
MSRIVRPGDRQVVLTEIDMAKGIAVLNAALPTIVPAIVRSVLDQVAERLPEGVEFDAPGEAETIDVMVPVLGVGAAQPDQVVSPSQQGGSQ